MLGGSMVSGCTVDIDDALAVDIGLAYVLAEPVLGASGASRSRLIPVRELRRCVVAELTADA